MINIRVIYFSVVLVLLVWGGGWLVYDFGMFYPSVAVTTWQNLLIVGVGVSLCAVVWMFMKPERGHEESIMDMPKIQSKKRFSGSLKNLIEGTPKEEPCETYYNLSYDELSRRLLETKPNSPERRQLMQLFMERKK